MYPNSPNGNAVPGLAGKKILFATFPADGHFNPLTGLAVHLQSLGCDVRWYTSPVYAVRLRKLGIPHFPFVVAKDINGENVEEVFPERNKIRGQIKKLRFDMINAFILRAPEYYEDMKDIRRSFPFDLVIADSLFSGIPFIKDKLQLPVIAVGVVPVTETSKDLPPPGMGLTPSYTWLGKIRQRVMRTISNMIIFREPNKVMHAMLEKHGIDHGNRNIFDLLPRKSTLVLQSGTPGFEYYRSDLGRNIRFVGAMLPYQKPGVGKPWFDERMNTYKRIIVVTQGTVERDINKLLVPTLEAMKGTDTLVIATTGGNGTAELRSRFSAKNLIIEDFIPFADIMPYADIYITNGGYGGVMLGIENNLPLIVAGVHEGKNEINARIGYFKLGINLGTEKPRPAQIRQAVDMIFIDGTYRDNVEKLAKEFSEYDTYPLCAAHIADALGYHVIKMKEEAGVESKAG